MAGEMLRKNKRKLSQCQKKYKEKESKDITDPHEAMDNLQATIGAIHKEVQAIHSDVIQKLGCFCDNLSKDMKRDLASFRDDVNEKLNEIVSDQKGARVKAEEATQRVADMEEWTAVAKEVLSQSLKNQDQIQARPAKLCCL